MNPAYYIPILLLLFVILSQNRRKRSEMMRIMAIKNRKEDSPMLEMAKRMIGKDCIVYLFDSQQIMGVIKEVGDRAVLVEREGGGEEIVNIDFVVRLREHPTNKKGKKKSVVID